MPESGTRTTLRSRVWVDRIPRFLWRWGVYSFDRAWRICLGPIEIVVVKR